MSNIDLDIFSTRDHWLVKTFVSAALAVPCDVPTVPDNALPVVGDFKVGDSILVTCKEGYAAKEDMTISCQEDRTWTQPRGRCQCKCRAVSLK